MTVKTHMAATYWISLALVLLLVHIGHTRKEKRFVVERDLEQELTDLRAEFNAFKTHMQSRDVASTFVRWGRMDCTKDSEFIYRGYLAGKKYDEQGSSSDSLCLPSDPTWANYTDSHETLRATLYGAEIDLIDPGNILFGKHVWEEDMPCAVCRAKFATTIMLPARSSCYPGWTLQYMGYLVTNLAVHAGSYDMICLDGDPEFIPHGNSNDNQHVVYVTEAHCGSLPCPPYVENRELACSVCSK